MARTVVGLYRTITIARDVVEDLVDHGFERDNISLVAADEDSRYSEYIDTDRTEVRREREVDQDVSDGAAAGAGVGAVIGALGGLVVGLGALAIPGIGPVIAAGEIASTLVGAGIGAAAGGLIGALIDLGIPEEEAEVYTEAVRRGGTLVVLRTADARAPEAVDIMEAHNPVDIERQTEVWREEGWTGFDTEAEPYRAEEGEETFEVVEEDLRVGKREVERGGVRVRSHVREEPVEEQVRVRDEEIHVERRPVDRPATERDLEAFEEGTVEMTERDEEVVVQKEPRVTEEVVLSKDVEERTETVRDTVRRTEVEVEDLGEREREVVAWETYEPQYRHHFEQNYATTGMGYDAYMPAYRYGYEMRMRPEYRERNWNQVEPDLRRGWEREHRGTWDRFRDAIEYAWHRVTP